MGKAELEERGIEQLVFYVLDAPMRRLIIENLSLSPRTSTRIANDTGKNRSAVSRSMQQLLAKNIVACKNEHFKRNRFYYLTEDGRKVKKKIEDLRL